MENIFLWTIPSNSLTENKEQDIPSHMLKTIFGLYASVIFRPKYVWFPVGLKGPVIPDPRGWLAELKLRSHMRGAVAERRRADFDIPAPLPRVCSHIRGADAERTRADLPFLEDNYGLERAVSKRTRQIGFWTHFSRSEFFSAPRPRMCEHM